MRVERQNVKLSVAVSVLSKAWLLIGKWRLGALKNCQTDRLIDRETGSHCPISRKRHPPGGFNVTLNPVPILQLL
ncbi:hypothetical protein SAMN05444358_101393 [Ruegeria halocynthiae]|uniref:Uncharacterized protein n=1 Tax=Ruegeria halocynthiae TaxID=985054 RepID=A0A1H2S913_9RHOB|nr:hypothetical protein SAMN05444358_101393 [Ruegeria halocynthiae]